MPGPQRVRCRGSVTRPSLLPPWLFGACGTCLGRELACLERFSNTGGVQPTRMSSLRKHSHRRCDCVYDRRHADPVRRARARRPIDARSEEHTSELQSLMRISYAVFCLKKKKYNQQTQYTLPKRNNIYT